MHPAYLQLLSIGFIWIFFHCSSMCGPIVSGLQLGSRNDSNWWNGVLLYQLGRSIIYVSLGAIAGGLGSEALFKNRDTGWVVFGILALMTLVQFFPGLFKFSVSTAILNRLSTTVGQLSQNFRPFAFGLVFAFLPCMLTLWVLSLAASTKSSLLGGGLMLLLILMTSFPLLAATGSSRWCAKRFHVFRMTPWLLLLSTIWTLLVSLAAQNSIAHQHFVFEVLGKNYTLMFW